MHMLQKFVIQLRTPVTGRDFSELEPVLGGVFS